jgi:hypothetical protein
MLCPCRTSTPRAPHQPNRQWRARDVPVVATSSRSSKSTPTTLSLSSSSSRLLPSKRVVAAAAAPPAQDAPSARGDGVITSAAAAGATTAASPAPPAAASSPSPLPPTPLVAAAASSPSPLPPPTPPLVAAPPDLLIEFEHKLQGDLKAVGVTIVAVTGVIVYWRGVWSLLDHVLGDSVFGDVACVAIGLLTVLGIRLSGAKMSSFWPTS